MRALFGVTTRRFGSTAAQNRKNAPLSGVRILDMTRIVAGPFCTMILADLGADVVKIERPGGGDESRRWGPPYVPGTQESCYFVSLNRNKRSICVDVKTEEGRSIVHELAKKSDVFVENYVPGKLDQLKLGYQHIRALSPKIIYCSITGYGAQGPYKHRPGYDVIAASLGGLLHITGPENGPPVKPGVAVTDMATGLYAHGAIMAAILQRNRTGIGQKIDCDLLSTQIASLINIGSNFLNAGREAQRWGTAHESIVPYQAFKTSDGFLTVGTGSDKQFQDLCRRIGQESLSEQDQFATNEARVKNRLELVGILQEVLEKRSKKEWMRVFDGASFPCGPVNTLQETFNDPHVKAINMVQEVEGSGSDGVSVKMVRPPVVYSEGANEIRRPPPTLGQHTEEVLTDILGYQASEIARLKAEKIVQ